MCCLLVVFFCVWENMKTAHFKSSQCSSSCGFGWLCHFSWAREAFSSPWAGLPQGLGRRSLVGWFASKEDPSGSGSCSYVCQKCVDPAVWGLLVLREKEVLGLSAAEECGVQWIYPCGM